jgi:nucleotide-binding universal stress UspA family protein
MEAAEWEMVAPGVTLLREHDADEAAEGKATVRRVIVGVDDSPSGLAALRDAVGLARSCEAQLVAVRAWALGLPRHGGRRMRHVTHPHLVLLFSDTQERKRARVLAKAAFHEAVGDVPAGVHIVPAGGDPAVVLTRLASQPGDVLVVGSQHRLSARHLVHGSVAAYCVRHAHCPIRAVHPDGSVVAHSPIRTENLS